MESLARSYPEAQRQASAAFLASTFHIDGLGVDPDSTVGLEYLKRAAHLGDDRAKALVRRFWRTFAPENLKIEDYMQWTIEAAEMGSHVALAELLVCVTNKNLSDASN